MQTSHHLLGRYVVSPEPLGIKINSYLPALSPGDVELRKTCSCFFELIARTRGQPFEAHNLKCELERVKERIGTSSMDLTFTRGWETPGRNPVIVGHEFVVKINNAFFRIFTHMKPDNGET